MQIGCRAAPIPHRNHDIALDALRPIGFRKRQFTGRDPVRPVSEEFERNLGVEPGDIAGHEVHRAAGLQAFRPGVGRVLEFAELLADRAHSRSSQRVARLAGATLDDGQPFTLAFDLG